MKNGEHFLVTRHIFKGEDIYAFRPFPERFLKIASHKVYSESDMKHVIIPSGCESNELIGIASADIGQICVISVDEGNVYCGDKIVGVVSHWPDYLPDGDLIIGE